VAVGEATVTTAEEVSGWRVGDEVIVTASQRTSRGRTFRNNPKAMHTEERRIAKIEGLRITLDRPLSRAPGGRDTP
jgi:hypothetical protein